MKHCKVTVGRAKKWQAEVKVFDRLGGAGVKTEVFDSEEEIFVLRWLEEAFLAGYVQRYCRGKTYKLFESVVIQGDYEKLSKRTTPPQLVAAIKERTLLRERTYTPDFEFVPTKKFYKDFLCGKECSEKLAGLLGMREPGTEGFKGLVVDVKGGYVLADRREEFNLKRHAMRKLLGIPVIEIDPAVLFALTWVPNAAAFTQKTGKRVSRFARCRLIGQESAGDGIIPDIPDEAAE